jgi:HEAT repeat protein
MNEPFPEINTKELIEKALGTKDEEQYWEYIRSLHIRGTKEVLDQATKLCESESIQSIITGADILGQIGVPERTYPNEALAALRELIKVQDQNPQILNSALVAIGHTQQPEDNNDLVIVRKLSAHDNEDVRLGAVMVLWGHEDPESISTLITLSHDPDPNVRDWATTGIGSIIEADSEEIRAALLDRVKSEDKKDETDTYYEALMGLAVRKDPRAIKPILENLKSEDPPSLIFEAAAEIGAREFIEPMEEQLNLSLKEEDIDKLWRKSLKENLELIKQYQEHNKTFQRTRKTSGRSIQR